MTVPYWIVDAFTDTAFRGNPAAVCLLDAPADESWMAAVAGEFALSETAFLAPRREGSGTGQDAGWHLRWFTPTVEVDLCGHATLASTAVLAREEGHAGPFAFGTRSGTLHSRVVEDGFELDLPADSVQSEADAGAAGAALGVACVGATLTSGWLLVEVADPDVVRRWELDVDAVAAVASDLDRQGVILTAAHGDRAVSRVFAPALGIPEDPVTGAAHCALGPYWEDRLGASFDAVQASARGGRLGVRTAGDRVHLTGGAVVVARGHLLAGDRED